MQGEGSEVREENRAETDDDGDDQNVRTSATGHLTATGSGGVGEVARSSLSRCGNPSRAPAPGLVGSCGGAAPPSHRHRVVRVDYPDAPSTNSGRENSHMTAA